MSAISNFSALSVGQKSVSEMGQFSFLHISLIEGFYYKTVFNFLDFFPKILMTNQNDLRLSRKNKFVESFLHNFFIQKNKTVHRNT